MGLHDPELRVGERQTLTQFLDFLRSVMARKLNGLTTEQAGAQLVPSSELTISGIIKHLALVEDSWFQDVLHGTPSEPAS